MKNLSYIQYQALLKTVETFESCFECSAFILLFLFFDKCSFQGYSIYHLFTKRENLRLRMFIGCGVVFFQQVRMVFGPNFFGINKIEVFNEFKIIPVVLAYVVFAYLLILYIYNWKIFLTEKYE